MRYTTFTDDETQLLFDETCGALAEGALPLSELTDHLLSLGGFDFLRERLDERGRRVTLNSVGNPLSMDWRFSSGPVFVNAYGEDDKLVARVDVALTGRVFTTQLSVADAATGSLSLDTDLIAFDELLFAAGDFSVNGEAGRRTVDSETGRCELRGSAGWLDDFRLGSSLAVTWADGELRVTVHDDHFGSGTNETKALVAYAREVHAGYGFSAFEPIMEQITVDPTAYRSAVPPVSQLLLDGGFEQRNGWFGRAGTDWHDPDVAEVLELRSGIIEKHRFGSCCTDAYDKVLELWGDHLLAKAEKRSPDVDYDLAGRLLAHATVADGFDDYLLHRLGRGPGMATLSTEFLLAVVNNCGPATSAAQYLIGKEIERSGRFDDAAHMYEMALATDQTYAPPCIPLAWLAFDRSKFGRARELLTRSGLEPRSREFSFLPRRAGGRSKPGRNECCPCGSGRKYKACHARTSLLSPWERLQLKYDRHVAATKSHTRVQMMAFIACGLDADRADRFRGDLFLTDVQRFEGHGLADFVEVRGSLFPADEHELAVQLCEVQRALYEVTQIGAELQLRDVASGASTTIGLDQLAASALSLDLQIGDRIFARLLQSTGSASLLFGEVLQISADVERSLLAVLSTAPSSDHDLHDNNRDMAHDLAAWYCNNFAIAALRGKTTQ